MRSAGARGRGAPDSFGQGVLQALGWSARDAVACTVGVCATGAILVNVLFLQSGPHPAPMVKASLLFPAAEATSNIGSMAPAAAPVAPLPAEAPKVNPPKAEPPKHESAKSEPIKGEPIKSEPAKVEPLKPEPARNAPLKPRTPGEIIAEIQRELVRRGFYDGTVDGFYGSKTDAAIRSFERAARLKPSPRPSEALLNAIAKSNIGAKNAHVAPLRLDPPPERVVAAPERIAPPALVPNVPSRRIASMQRVLADFGYGQLSPTGVVDAETRAAIEKFERTHKLPITGEVSDRVAKELGTMTGRPLD